MTEKFTAYITKYALTEGIISVEVTLGHFPGVVREVGEARWVYTYAGADWHRTREAAVASAEKMRAKRIASLEKQIAKLKALDFEGTTPSVKRAGT